MEEVAEGVWRRGHCRGEKEKRDGCSVLMVFGIMGLELYQNQASASG